MSEYQYVAFRAIDAPVSKQNLAYMRRQSTRAQITPWAFTNEYHYGDFRGDALEMLRRGYDLHLHCAKFGTRTLMIRLPHGLLDAAKPYLSGRALRFSKDPQGPGGTLIVDPFYEAGELETLWGLDEVFAWLVPLRSEILEGDLRPLYLAHLAVCRDDSHDPEETVEAPVPAGLTKLTTAQTALAEFYDLSRSLLVAAARPSPPPPSEDDRIAAYAEWISGQPAAAKDRWLLEVMRQASGAVRSEMLTRFREARPQQVWPTVRWDRTLEQLASTAEEIAREADRRAAAQAARRRKEMLASMAEDPEPYLRKAEQLVAQRNAAAYREISRLLADLREALAGSERAKLPEQQAQQLKKKHPTLRLLTAALRQQGFVPK